MFDKLNNSIHKKGLGNYDLHIMSGI